MSVDFSDYRVVLIHGALLEVLGKMDTAKIVNYFTDDAVMIINEKVLQRPDIEKRIQWVKNNSKSVEIKLHNAFFDGEQGFDYHTTEVVHIDGTRSLYKIFGYIKLRDNKICHYEDITIQLAGEKSSISSATSTA